MADRCTLKCQSCGQKFRRNRELKRHLFFNRCSAPSPLPGFHPSAVKTAPAVVALPDAEHSPFNVDKSPPYSISVDIGDVVVEEITCASDTVTPPSSNDQQPGSDVIRPTVVDTAVQTAVYVADTAVQTAVCWTSLPPDYDLNRPVRPRSWRRLFDISTSANRADSSRDQEPVPLDDPSLPILFRPPPSLSIDTSSSAILDCARVLSGQRPAAIRHCGCVSCVAHAILIRVHSPRDDVASENSTARIRFVDLPGMNLRRASDVQHRVLSRALLEKPATVAWACSCRTCASHRVLESAWRHCRDVSGYLPRNADETPEAEECRD